jgi:hypothetical protein
MNKLDRNAELNNFNNAMDTILRADPKVVKAQMEVEKGQRAAKREAKKMPSASGHVSTDLD